MKILCKKNYQGFEEGKYYEIAFKNNEFIIIVSEESLENCWYQFGLNTPSVYNRYVYDYFTNIAEERKFKLEQLSKIKS